MVHEIVILLHLIYIISCSKQTGAYHLFLFFHHQCILSDEKAD